MFMTESWQLILCWGVLVGLGTGSMALAFVATVTNRWFVKRKGLVTGILTAGGATGQLIFLPLLAWLSDHHSWKSVPFTVTVAALTVIAARCCCSSATARRTSASWRTAPANPAIRRRPRPRARARPAAPRAYAAGARPGHRTRVFWLLAGTFAICGASTFGLIGTHFIPAAHDHGMAKTAAAGLLALIGIFDIAGTIASGG